MKWIGVVFIKRLCVYLTYDRQKRVDRYIGYMLKELKTCVDTMAVVCNEPEILVGADMLTEYADKIFYRENIGFDAGGFKDALCDFIGWEQVLRFDEIVLVNDSVFGPFRSMKSIFGEMEDRTVDFWGLSKHGEAVMSNLGHVPEHLQSFFLSIGTRMLHSREFQNYWEDMPYFSSYIETIKNHELKFTKFFSDLGYTYDSLADTEANDSADIRNNYSQYAFISYEMIKKRNFPFFKKRQITFNTLPWQTQENLRQSIEYIDKETNYDADMIWENIVRVFHMADLHKNLHLQYIIPPLSDRNVKESVIFAVFVNYESAAEYVMEYIKKLGSRYCVRVFSEKQKCLEKYKESGLECRQLRRGEIVYVLVEFSKYDFVCVLQDADMASNRRSNCVDKSLFYNKWENLIKDNDHVSGILNCFERETRLGFLMPPLPNFENYFGTYKMGWAGKFETVRNIADRMGLNCQISETKGPFGVTENFWIRGRILKKIDALREEDCFLPYLWTLLTQDAGYYSGIVESVEYAAINEVNQQYYLSQFALQVEKQCGDFNTYEGMREKIRLIAVQEFCKKYSRILIYGAGEMAVRYGGFLAKKEAYIVSDGQMKPEKLDDVPVKYLSEVDGLKQCGIVLCLSEENQAQVIPLLEMNGVKNYFCM